MSSRLGRLDCGLDSIPPAEREPRLELEERNIRDCWDRIPSARAAPLGARDSDELETNTTFANVKAEFLKIATDRPHTLRHRLRTRDTKLLGVSTIERPQGSHKGPTRHESPVSTSPHAIGLPLPLPS